MKPATTITTTRMQTALLARYNELTAKVQDEEANLSDFRKNEAFDLALTDEEQSDLTFLCNILGQLGGTWMPGGAR